MENSFYCKCVECESEERIIYYNVNSLDYNVLYEQCSSCLHINTEYCCILLCDHVVCKYCMEFMFSNNKIKSVMTIPSEITMTRKTSNTIYEILTNSYNDAQTNLNYSMYLLYLLEKKSPEALIITLLRDIAHYRVTLDRINILKKYFSNKINKLIEWKIKYWGVEYLFD